MSGPKPNSLCVFPFKFNGTTYNKCTKAGNAKNETEAWCSTAVNHLGEHIGNKGNWGNCAPNCRPDSFSKYIQLCSPKTAIWPVYEAHWYFLIQPGAALGFVISK